MPVTWNYTEQTKQTLILIVQARIEPSAPLEILFGG